MGKIEDAATRATVKDTGCSTMKLLNAKTSRWSSKPRSTAFGWSRTLARISSASMGACSNISGGWSEGDQGREDFQLLRRRSSIEGRGGGGAAALCRWASRRACSCRARSVRCRGGRPASPFCASRQSRRRAGRRARVQAEWGAAAAERRRSCASPSTGRCSSSRARRLMRRPALAGTARRRSTP